MNVKAIKTTDAAARENARQQLVETLFDLWASQFEILRLADHWSRYEAALITATEQAKDVIAPLLDQPVKAISDARAALSQNNDLTSDQLEEAVRRAFKAAAVRQRENGSSDEMKTGAVMKKVLARREDLGLLSSQLVTLVADFELFVLRVMTIWLELDPTYINGRKREFTFQELSSFDSIADLTEAEIHTFLEDHMRKSATDWFSQFGKMLDVKHLEGASDFTLMEVFQRRHVLVHHGGLVSRQYLKKLSEFRHSAELGDHLPVDFTYVKNAADSLAIVAHSIVLSALFAAAATDEERSRVEEEAGELTFQLLNQDRDLVVERFCDTFQLNRIKREFTRGQLEVNGWIAKTRLGKAEEVLAHVEKWDVAAKDNVFKVARLALMRDPEGVAGILSGMIKAEQFSIRSVATWPLFESIRSELWDELKKRLVDEE